MSYGSLASLSVVTPLASYTYTRSLKTVKLFLANEAHYVGDTACALAVPKHEVVSLRYDRLSKAKSAGYLGWGAREWIT